MYTVRRSPVAAIRIALHLAVLMTMVPGTPLLAQSGGATVSPQARQVAARYLAVSGAEDFGKAFLTVSQRAVAARIRRYTPGLAARPDSIESLIATHLGWQRVHSAAVDALVLRFGEGGLARAVGFYETPWGKRMGELRRMTVRELLRTGQPLDSFPSRFSNALRGQRFARAEMDSVSAFLARPEGRLFTPLTDVWLNSVSTAWSDFERRFPGVSGGRVDPVKRSVEFEVDKHATPLPNNPAPFFPSALRESSSTGSVQAEFVVTTAGVVDTTSFRVLRSSHELFTAAVRSMLPAWRFTPAELFGHRVNQRVVQEFQFSLTPAAARKDTTAR